MPKKREALAVLKLDSSPVNRPVLRENPHDHGTADAFELLLFPRVKPLVFGPLGELQ